MPIPSTSPIRMDDAYCSICLGKMKKEWDKRTGVGYVLYTCANCGYRQSASPVYVTTRSGELIPQAKEKD